MLKHPALSFIWVNIIDVYDETTRHISKVL
jgi:hypothetical protein